MDKGKVLENLNEPSLYYFRAIFYKVRLKKCDILGLLAEAPPTHPSPNLGPKPPILPFLN